MKKILPSFLLFFILTGTFVSNAQSIAFQRADSIPVVIAGVTLNNPWAGGIDFPLFSEIDLNGDGMHDLFLHDRSNNRISTFINTGISGVNTWHYAPEYVSKFPPINKWARLYDYNCDGKMDLFTLSPCQCGVAVYRNDYNITTGLQFTLVTSTIMDTAYSLPSQVYADYLSLPTFGDVDGDGDMDIIGYSSFSNGRFFYNRNYSVEYGFGCDSLYYKQETDNWGKFQLFIGGSNSVYCFNCRKKPVQPQEEFFSHDELDNYDQSQAARRDDTISSVFMIDIDGDGDKDLLIGDSGATNSLLVVNGGTADTAQMVTQDITFPSANIPVNISNFPMHSYLDLDNDSINDLIAAPTDLENFRGMWYYKNSGTTASPDLHWQNYSFLVDQMIDVGEGACPVLFDENSDGLPDLVIGNYGIYQAFSGSYKNGLQLFRNTGTATAPAFQLVNNNFANINALGLTGPIYPAFSDLDRDGDVDMMIGSDNGKLVYFNNTAGAGNPPAFAAPVSNYMGIDVGNTSTPQMVDLSGDSLPDLVIGNKNGFIKYYQNTGSIGAPFFPSAPTIDTLGGINVQTVSTPDGYAVPFFFTENGQHKLLVSCEKGDVYLYDDIDGNLNGNFNLAQTIISGTQGTRIKFNLAVSGGDLNNDGLTDMVLGIYTGGVNIYYQQAPSAVSELHSVISPGFEMAPNPSTDNCLIHFSNLPDVGKNHLNVMNYLGQIVFSKVVTSNRMTLDTHELPSGIYMVQLVSAKSSLTKKMVVNR